MEATRKNSQRKHRGKHHQPVQFWSVLIQLPVGQFHIRRLCPWGLRSHMCINHLSAVCGKPKLVEGDAKIRSVCLPPSTLSAPLPMVHHPSAGRQYPQQSQLPLPDWTGFAPQRDGHQFLFNNAHKTSSGAVLTSYI